MPVITSKSLHAAAAPIENGDIVGLSESATVDDELDALGSREAPPPKSTTEKSKHEQDLWGLLNDVPASSNAQAAFSGMANAIPPSSTVGTAATGLDLFAASTTGAGAATATPTAANDLFGLLDTTSPGKKS